MVPLNLGYVFLANKFPQREQKMNVLFIHLYIFHKKNSIIKQACPIGQAFLAITL